MNNFFMRQLLFLCLDILLRNDRKSQRHFFFQFHLPISGTTLCYAAFDLVLQQ